MSNGRTGIALYSTKSLGTDALSLDSLGAHLRGAMRVDIASAYYQTSFCEDLLAKAGPTARSIRLLFNGLGGARLEEQRKELADLEGRLGRRRNRVEIRLAFEPGIFHTKLFLIHGRGGATAFLGSANATNAAMTVNEEILARLPDRDSTFVGYFERAWDKGVPLAKLDQQRRARSLVAFFRSGSLYFKPSTTLSVSFNPFSDCFRKLPEREVAKLRAVQLPFSDAESGVGAFNVRKALGLSRKDEVEDGEVSKASASIKPRSVETCFGYWVPSAVEPELKEALEQAGKRKKRRLLNLCEAIDAFGERRLKSRYEEYRDALAKHLRQSGVRLERTVVDAQDPMDTTLFERFLGGLLSRLHDERYLQRLYSPFVSGVMPEIWDDHVARSDFEGSFFDALAQVSSRGKRWNRVPGTILRRAGVHGAARAEEIQEGLASYLKSTGWADADWLGPR